MDSNFFATVREAGSAADVAQAFRRWGWQVTEPDDSNHWEASCGEFDVVIEPKSGGRDMLVHGYVDPESVPDVLEIISAAWDVSYEVIAPDPAAD